jgi:N-acetyl sugar amidotransferase
MDETAKNIVFDEEGNCNFCTEYIDKLNNSIYMSKSRDQELENIVNTIKKDGKNKEYDCIMGVSGGLDSSYLLLKAVELGLRPLAVHLDNGWNSELAVKNIDNLVKKLNVDLYTHVIDWDEFRELQKSFFNADVIDIELLTDHAIISIMYKLANKYNIKYMLPGTNISNEGMDMPKGWNHFKWDITNIKDIYQKFGPNKSLNTYPSMSILKYFYYSKVKKIQWISLLDYMDFDKSKSLEILQEKVAYVPYEKKHYESIFTRFYQGYILPLKFNVDKRRLHFSTLICSGQLTRESVLIEIEKSPYNSKQQLEDDKEYVLKKLNFSEQDFIKYMIRAPKLHSAYASNTWLLDLYRKYK